MNRALLSPLDLPGPMLGYSLHNDGSAPTSDWVRILATLTLAPGLVALQAFSLAHFQLTRTSFSAIFFMDSAFLHCIFISDCQSDLSLVKYEFPTVSGQTLREDG